MFQLSCSARLSKKEGKKDYISNLFDQVWVQVDKMILWVTGREKPTEILVCSPKHRWQRVVIEK